MRLLALVLGADLAKLMDAAVDLDHETSGIVAEIEDVVRNGELATEMRALAIQGAQ
jgi:hypothetical protein